MRLYRDAELVIEAAPENIQLKNDVFKQAWRKGSS